MTKQTHTIELPNKVTVNLDTFIADKNLQSVIILILPAMGVKASYYAPLAKNLVSKGITAMSVDLRGLGTYSIRPSRKVDFGYLEMIEDLKTVVHFIKKNYPKQKIYGLGHSLGGQIAALAQAKYPDLLYRVWLWSWVWF